MSLARFYPPERSTTVTFSWESAWRPVVGAFFARARLSLGKTGLLYACGLKASTLKLYRTCARTGRQHTLLKRTISRASPRTTNTEHFTLRFRFLARRFVRGGSRSETTSRDLSTGRSTHSSHVDLKRAKATTRKQRDAVEAQFRAGEALDFPAGDRSDRFVYL